MLPPYGGEDAPDACPRCGGRAPDPTTEPRTPACWLCDGTGAVPGPRALLFLLMTARTRREGPEE